MKRIRLKHKKKKLLSYFLILAFLLVISLILVFNYIGKNISDKVQKYADFQAKKFISNVIIEELDEEIISYMKESDIFIEKNNTIDFNSSLINESLIKISKKLEKRIEQIEDGNDTDFKNGIIYEIPTGIIFNNALLANIGPKIPVRLHMLGDISSEIETNLKDYGINNAIIEVYVKVKVSVQVVLPFSDNKISLTERIPIALKLIQGEIPNYYLPTQLEKE